MVEGKRVKLEFDPANEQLKQADRFGRTLEYVFLEDGTLLNTKIIRQGYGFAMSKYPFPRMEEFTRLEREARERRRAYGKLVHNIYLHGRIWLAFIPTQR